MSLASAGIASAAARKLLDLPESLTVPLTAGVAAGLAAAPFAERVLNQSEHAQAHDHEHEHDDHIHDHDHPAFSTSYAPKLIALTVATLAPVAAHHGGTRPGRRRHPETPAGGVLPRHSPDDLPPAASDDGAAWLRGLIYQVAAAATLAAATSGSEYYLRIEEYRSFNLDWSVPLAAGALSFPHALLRAGALAGLVGTWGLAVKGDIDPLARLDPGHAEGHTHHISAAQRLIGDAVMALGPRPARKWAGLAPFGVALGAALARTRTT